MSGCECCAHHCSGICLVPCMQAALAIVEIPLVPVIVMTCALAIKTVVTTMSNYVPVSESSLTARIPS